MINEHRKIETKDAQGISNGWLLEIISDRDGVTPHLTGQMYLTVAEPGMFKGYHLHALADYAVTCIRGSVEETIYYDSNNKKVITMGDDNFRTLHLPRGIPHGIRNIGNEPAYVLIYRWPSWDPNIKEQLDIAPADIEKPESWELIKKFVESFATAS